MNATPGVIAKESCSAYQRWELASLEPPQAASATPDTRPAVDPAMAQASDVARLHALAAAEGRAAGRAEGLAEAATDVARLHTLLQSLGAALDERDQRIGDAVLDLALVLARQIAGDALAVRRELLLPAISAALAKLPETTQRVRLHLCPGDLDLVRALSDANPEVQVCQLAADASLLAGGFRLETEQCELDATLQSRWHRLASSLGRSYEWLDNT